MCGIYGYVGLPTLGNQAALQKFMTQYMYAGVVRGMDATGYYSVNRSKNILHTRKFAIPGYEFAKTEYHEEMLERVKDSQLTVVHHRATTVGGDSDENAHPFQYKGDGDRIIGVHNGTLKRTPSSPHPVDSARLYKGIADHGLQEAIKQSSGAFALCMYSFEDKEFRMVRNNSRPLHIMKMKGGTGWLFGSAAAMLFAIAKGSKINADDTVYKIQDGQLYTWDLRDPSHNLIQFKKEEFDTTPRYVAPPAQPVSMVPTAVAQQQQKMWFEDDDFAWDGRSNHGYKEEELKVEDLEDDAVVHMKNFNYDEQEKSVYGRCTMWGTKGKITSSEEVGVTLWDVEPEQWELIKTMNIVPVFVRVVWEEPDGWPMFEAGADWLDEEQLIQWYDEVGQNRRDVYEGDVVNLTTLSMDVDHADSEFSNEEVKQS